MSRRAIEHGAAFRRRAILLGGSAEASAPVVVVPSELTAVRAGGSDKSLAGYTDSGSPDYAYDGTSGSDALVIEDYVVATDSVGIIQLWDHLTDDYTTGFTIVGEPGGRALDASDQIGLAAGLTPTSSGNYPTGWVLPTTGSLAIYHTSGVDATNIYLIGPDSGGPIYVWNRATEINCRLFDSVGTTILTQTHTGLTASRRYALLVEWDPDTPGAGVGTLKSAVLDLVTQTVGSTLTDMFTVSSTNFAAGTHWIGRAANGNNYNAIAGLGFDEFSTRVITDGTLADIADGSDPTGGVVMDRSLQGIRTGVWDGVLDYAAETGAGADVTAQ